MSAGIKSNKLRGVFFISLSAVVALGVVVFAYSTFWHKIRLVNFKSQKEIAAACEQMSKLPAEYWMISNINGTKTIYFPLSDSLKIQVPSAIKELDPKEVTLSKSGVCITLHDHFSRLFIWYFQDGSDSGLSPSADMVRLENHLWLFVR